MNRAVLCCAVVSSFVLTFLSFSAANADVIDASGSATDSVSFLGLDGSDTAGGTFTHAGPEGASLDSFSLWLGIDGGLPMNDLTAVVYGTDGSGAPDASNVLWSSSSFEAADPTPVLQIFNPSNVYLGNGQTYFVGVVSGIVDVLGMAGDFTIEAAVPAFIGDDRIAGGSFWSSSNGGAFVSIDNWDIRTTIVTTNPEPSTALLIGMGLGLLAQRRRKDRSKHLH